MTSGHAIAHAERTPTNNSGRLNGVQLWTALPDQQRNRAASFQHVSEVPVSELPGGVAYVFAGRSGDVVSPAEHFSDLIRAELRVHRGVGLSLPLERQYEHALLLLEGDSAFNGQRLAPGLLYYLGTQRTEMTLTSADGGRVFLVG